MMSVTGEPFMLSVIMLNVVTTVICFIIQASGNKQRVTPLFTTLARRWFFNVSAKKLYYFFSGWRHPFKRDLNGFSEIIHARL
jgi:hypothetical protein